MIQIENLTKRYGSFTAVDDITFTARPGRVTGFLGPNGAGKSTAMRMLVGLTVPSSGSALVLGRPYRSLPTPARHVGVMLDAAAQHAGRTGRETLVLAAAMAGMPRHAVDRALERVGLTSREAERRVGNYSLGMRQRLGLAGALIGEPQVLVLDEPANGLDPAGIRWMRGLLRDFADQGGTVLLSSHLLHEVEQVAHDIVMIGGGRIVAEGTQEELLAGHGQTVVGTPEGERARLAAELRGAGHQVDLRGEDLVTNATRAQVARIALTAGVPVTHLAESSAGRLEEMFLQLTADQARQERTEEVSA
ncbi:ABC transporter ATP-binding protein [Ornithinimicrobium tianjinense]|uniref:ABC transporter n=1 Tax=Ornithinimicrobium tianjinense TaxID=1195761 RepID=A0A917BCK8_9MICO|nr:ATP-binding cassette domain-containing protein [Ornithinimicrobium tianjinense]GGF36687.1 ABC transporter [Ornithinimicrobium tianjinense]